MADREKVLNGLEACADRTGALCRTCPYDFRKEGCISDMAEDALELLTEQEALPIAYMDNPYTGLPVAHCPKCGKFVRQYHAVYEEETKFCPYCGQAVKWDD